jgi:diguanylate cyclase (GGDEF)-like protein
MRPNPEGATVSYQLWPTEAVGVRNRFWQHLQWLEPLLSAHKSVPGCVVLSLCMLPFLLLFWGMHSWALFDSAAGQFYRRELLMPVQSLLTINILLLAGIAVLYWPRYRSEQSRPLLVLVTTCTLFFTLSGLTVLYGHKDAPLAIVQLGLLLLARGLFTTRQLLPALVIAALLVLGTEALVALGKLRYAPLLVEPIFTGGTLNWWWDIWVRVIYNIAVLLFSAMLFFLFWIMDRRQAQLEQLTRVDTLTGLLNRTTFMRQLEEEGRKQLRTQRPASVLMCDIDHFKQINDNHGHAAGDLVLQRFGELLRNATRHPVDVAGRFGGEEFVVLLPETDLPNARVVAERICEQLRDEHFEVDGKSFRVTVSIGLAEARDGNGERALRIADEHLYRAKHTGRDRVMSY